VAKTSKTKKKELRLISNLEEVAQTLQIPVNYDKFYGRGGLCSLYGRFRIIINRNLNSLDKIEILSKALNSFPLEEIFILPEVREVLDNYVKGSN
jgi:hypothetical protein